MKFAYDYLGRRVQKVIEEYDLSTDTWSTVSERRFIWAGWLMLMELDGSNNAVRKYTWGLDLAGQNGSLNSLEDAGGIGGLLAVHDVDSSEDYVYCYDGNGNVGQMIAWAPNYGGTSGNTWDTNPGTLARVVARYEYDPYGNIVGPDTNEDGAFDASDNPGSYADDNPIRFSTKYWDDETDLGYWGYRYYSPRLGRWISRDPIEERGGLLLHAYANNNPASTVDPLGEFGLCDLLLATGGFATTLGDWPFLSKLLPELLKAGLPIGGIPMLRARVIAYGELQMSDCCDRNSGRCGTLVCGELGLDVALVFGTVEKPRDSGDTRTKTQRQVSTYRDRKAFLTGGITLPSCDYQFNAGLRAFVRGGAGIGIAGGQFNWIVTEGHWNCAYGKGCHWEGKWFENDFQAGFAFGISGAALEAGINFYLSGCFPTWLCD